MCVCWVMIYCLFLSVSCCISYLLLHNYYFKIYLTWQAFVISPFLRAIRNSLARLFQFRVSHQAAVKMPARAAAVMWKLYGGWGICFQDVSLTRLESWHWLSVEVLSSSLRWPLYRVTWMSLQYGCWLSPKEATQENKAEMAMTFMT